MQFSNARKVLRVHRHGMSPSPVHCSDFVAVSGNKVTCFWIQSILFREPVWTGQSFTVLALKDMIIEGLRTVGRRQ